MGDKLFKYSIGGFLGSLGLGLMINLIAVIFKKPHEQIAKEKCAEVVALSKKYSGNQPYEPFLTIYVEGQEYRCN